MDDNRIAELLYPEVTRTPEQLEQQYPARALPEGASVTRVAPSPTGYLHIGGIYQAIIDERTAHQSGGVFMLRIEDTDQKREVTDGVKAILDGITRFGLTLDEGATLTGDNGAYGPYRQRQRVEIYKVFAKKLVAEGKAYPCFCSGERLADMRAQQEADKANPGYYGEYAACRNLSYDEIKRHIDEGDSFVLRLKSQGDAARRIVMRDELRGELEMPENEIDAVLLKSDGVPVYHFAHVVDDHLMRVTQVVRGEEWLATWPIHVQLFSYMGWALPKYVHTPNIMKLDETSGEKRKISKRKDPEAAMEFFFAAGYPRAAMTDYLMALLNSDYEEWRAKNPDAKYTEFPFAASKMAHSGALFDFAKLHDVCKNTVSHMSADEAYNQAAEWAELYDRRFFQCLTRDASATHAMLSIGRGGAKPRKDIGIWSELPAYMGFFFPEYFAPEYVFPGNMPREDVLRVLDEYPAIYNPADDQTAWFDRIKALAVSMGYAPDTKSFKKNPGAYPGHAGDISMVLRVAVTGRQQSPDLHQVMAVLGADAVKARLHMAKA